MRRVLAVAALVIAAAMGQALAERRVALVMAADDYRTIRPFENAVNDAQAVDGALKALGFEVSGETNRDLRRMRRALAAYAVTGTVGTSSRAIAGSIAGIRCAAVLAVAARPLLR